MYNKMICFKQIKFIIEDTKVKHKNITPIYNYNYKESIYKSY